jgi:biopolymer transport protein ExbD
MKSFTINTRARSNLFALTVIALGATLLVTPRAGYTQEMQRGVSVQMPVTSNATFVPDADHNDAWVVAVTADGNLYFGANPMTREGLAEWMKTHPRNREAKLYIKADARAPFSAVEKVLAVAREDFFQDAVLLTSKAQSPEPGTVMSPQGLEVLIAPTLPTGVVATVLQLLDPGKQPPTLKINNDPVSWSAVQTTLLQHFQKGDEKVILLKADRQMPFASVARAIDICRSTGAKVVISTPEL